jgi:LmeA-like phospholipid-binding
VVFVVVAVVLVTIADHFAVHWTESTVATRIEQRFPGSHATVTVSSSPYLVRLAVTGTVENVHAHVTDVTDNGLRLDTVDVTAHHLKLNRGDLLHGETRLESVSSATITARASLSEVLRAYGLGYLANLGSLGSGVKGTVRSEGNQAQISFGPLSFTFNLTSLVPCTGSAQISAGEVVLSCTTHSVPPALQAAGAGLSPS